MENQSFWWTHIGLRITEPYIGFTEQKMSIGYAIVSLFQRDGWKYIPAAHPGDYDKVVRGDEILWLQLPAFIDGVVLAENVKRIRSLLEELPAVQVTDASRAKEFLEWSVEGLETPVKEIAA